MVSVVSAMCCSHDIKESDIFEGLYYVSFFNKRFVLSLLNSCRRRRQGVR